MNRLSPIPFYAEPVLAGTLSLMSVCAGVDSVSRISKICANLEWLATNPELSKDLRTVCAKLLDQWESKLAEGAMSS